MGRENTDRTAGGRAGWEIGSAYSASNPGASGGAMGLFLINSASTDFAASPQTGTLAAIFYCSEGRVDLSGTIFGSGSDVGLRTTGSSNALIQSAGTNKEFVALVKKSGSALDVSETITFNFDENSKKYIRKVFNTNPTLLGSEGERQYASTNRRTYVLGETFDREVSEYVTNTGENGNVLGVMVPLANSNTDTNHNRSNLIKGSTGWIISQDLNNYSSFYPENNNIKKLFRFRSLEGGDWNQQNIKVSIRDITAPANEFQPYGTFTVEIRDASDSDADPVVLESFTNCNLNPSSENYIARKIGDSYVEWSDSDRSYRDYGDYPNKSKYVYVDVHSDVRAAANDPELLPIWILWTSPIARICSY